MNLALNDAERRALLHAADHANRAGLLDWSEELRDSLTSAILKLRAAALAKEN